MKCTFCENEIFLSVWVCDCNENVISCSRCSGFGCYNCKQNFKPITLSKCGGCHKDFPQDKMFGKKFDMYCVECCFQGFKAKVKGKKVIFNSYIFEPEKYDVYNFLKNFCFSCHKSLPKSKINSEPVGVREIYPLDNNLCENCLNIKYEDNSIPEQYYESNGKKSGKEYGRQKQEKYENKNHHTQNMMRQTKKNLDKQTPEQKWKQIQGKNYPWCLACDFKILLEPIITEDMITCYGCFKGSQIMESRLKKSRMSTNQGLSESRNLRKEQNFMQSVPTAYSYDQSESRMSKSPLKNKDTKAQSQSKQNLKSPHENSMKKSYLSTASRRSKQQPILQHEDSTKPQKVDLQIKLPNDEQLIECSNCGIEIEISSSIWKEGNNILICRCCFRDLLRDIEEEEKKQKNLSSSRNTKYISKEYQAREKEKPKKEEDQKTNGISSPSKVSQESSVKNSKAIEQAKSSSKSQQHTQPIIKQQVVKQSLNKVKRTESWDDKIIMQPVSDHEERKRLEKQNGNPIKEIIEETYDQESQTKTSQHMFNSQKNESEKNRASDYELKKSAQPTIIEEEQSSRKVHKHQSLDNSDLSQPLPEEEIKQEMQKSSPDILQQYEAHGTSNKKLGNNNEKLPTFGPEECLPTQPQIVQQRNQTKFKVNKMSSWNEDIILEPKEEHQRRKREQKLQEEKMKLQENTTKKVQPQQEKKSPPKQQRSNVYNSNVQNEVKTEKKYQNTDFNTQSSPKPAAYGRQQTKIKEKFSFEEEKPRLIKDMDEKFNDLNKKTGNRHKFEESLKRDQYHQNKRTSKSRLYQQHDNIKNFPSYNRQFLNSHGTLSDFKNNRDIDSCYEKFRGYFNSPFFQGSLFNKQEDDLAERYRESGRKWKHMSGYPPQHGQTLHHVTSNLKATTSYFNSPQSQKTLVCYYCGKRYIVTSKEYSLNHKNICLECYGQHNKQAKRYWYV